MTDKLKILFAGSGAFGLPTLQRLVAAHEVLHVYTQPDRPAGRGKKLSSTPVGEWAESNGLPLTKTARLNAEALPPADVLVVIAFGQWISDAVADHPRLGAVNLHASLLPKYRGAAPIHHALINGEAIVGNSVIRLAKTMDAGAILGQSDMAVEEAQTTGELHDRLAQDGPDLVLKVLNELSSGTAIEQEQPEHQATLAPKLSRADAAVDFTRPAPAFASQINGLSPWPGCRVEINGRPVTLIRARALPGPGEPGIIDRDGLVGTADGRLEIIELQPSGKRPMTLSAYRNGRQWEAGMRVEPEN